MEIRKILSHCKEELLHLFYGQDWLISRDKGTLCQCFLGTQNKGFERLQALLVYESLE